jgi:nicotinate dehydrogenase subunit A
MPARLRRNATRDARLVPALAEFVERHDWILVKVVRTRRTFVTIRAMGVMTLTVNGQRQTIDVDPATPLLYVLSDDLQLNGPKFGCGLGQCGCCTVIVKGQAVRSCITPVSTVAGGDVTTLEGLGTIDKPHPIQQAFIDEQAIQCGFCVNGVIMTAKAYLDRNPKATEADIRQAMSTVLCRCGAHTRMMKAIARYAKDARA